MTPGSRVVKPRKAKSILLGRKHGRVSSKRNRVKKIGCLTLRDHLKMYHTLARFKYRGLWGANLKWALAVSMFDDRGARAAL